MTIQAPANWSAGIEWGTNASEGAYFEWDADVPTSGRPHVYVAIAGVLTNGFDDGDVSLQSGSWSMGRNDWFDVLAPGQATFGFAGVVSATAGEQIVVSCETTTLWVGNVEDVAVTQDASGAFWTTVTGVDVVGRLGQATVIPSGSLTVGSLTFRFFPFAALDFEDVLASYLADYGGGTWSYTIGDSVGTLPTLIDWTDPPEVTLLGILNTLEQTSNAMLALQPDGSLILVMRDAAAASSVTTIDLTGVDAPSSWSTSTSPTNVVNHWNLTQPAYNATTVLDEADADSVEAYGDHSYTVADFLCATSTHYTSAMKAFLLEPRPLVTDGRFPVYDLSQQIIGLAPLEWVTQGGDTWQVMSVRHDFSGGADWTVSITADVSQNTLAATAEPDPDDPPGGLSTTTDNYTSTKSATVADTGANAGNGGGNRLAVGRYDGVVARALIDFTDLAKPANYVSVKKATLTVRTGDQSWVGFGSDPRFYCRRITESWSEGTYSTSPPSQYSVTNAVVWPGPSKTSVGQTYKDIGRAEDTDRNIDVTDQVQAMFDANQSFGFMLISVNESSNSPTIEFYSDDYGTAGARPRLSVTCYVSA